MKIKNIGDNYSCRTKQIQASQNNSNIPELQVQKIEGNNDSFLNSILNINLNK